VQKNGWTDVNDLSYTSCDVFLCILEVAMIASALIFISVIFLIAINSLGPNVLISALIRQS